MAEEKSPLAIVSTSQNKPTIQLIVTGITAPIVWYLNEKLKAGIPAEIAMAFIGALCALISYLIPNRRVAPDAANDEAFDARVAAAVQAALAKMPPAAKAA